MDGEKYIHSNYGPLCKDACWKETAEEIAGYLEMTYDEKEEQAKLKRRKEYKTRPKWGDDL
ncbi:hypothetical protein ACXM0N_09800 [Peribacillus simplex]